MGTSEKSEQAGEIQNITGEINAIFPNLSDPGGNPYLRAPYHSKNIRSLRFFGNLGTIQINSSSGEAPSTQPTYTGDYRSIDFTLKEGITSGTYRFPDAASDAIRNVTYSEFAKIGDNYYTQSQTAIEATLELEASTDGRHLTSRRFDITVKTHKEVILAIEADFDLYLAIE